MHLSVKIQLHMIRFFKYSIILLLVYSFATCSNEYPFEFQEEIHTDTEILSYKPAKMFILTQDEKPISGKEKKDYVSCIITLEHDSVAYNFTGEGKIKGRGNTTWEWFPKKPYRIKLNTEASLMGMHKEKDWVLLANYRDPTDMMNAFAFEVGRLSMVPYSNNNRFVELYINNQYNGIYQLTEQIEIGEHRVNICPENGIILSMDVDDGPKNSPNTGDNFISKQYNIPICVKYPDDISKDKIDSIRQQFYQLEKCILENNYEEFCQITDVESFADFILIQELVCNIDFCRPGSIYIHRNMNNKWTMGPLWDFDSAYDFDWSKKETGHDYFISDNNLILGSNPAELKGITEKTWFFTHLFKMPEFIQIYKKRWDALKDKVMAVAWKNTYHYFSEMIPLLYIDNQFWEIDKNPETEVCRMQQWLEKRIVLMDETINNMK